MQPECRLVIVAGQFDAEEVGICNCIEYKAARASGET
jgi:hypothetical protein